MSKIIDGKKISEDIKKELKKEIEEKKLKPGLAVIIIGSCSASLMYVKNKEKACQEVGIYFQKYELTKNVAYKEVLEIIDKLNKDSKISGIIVQLPLPLHLKEREIASKIHPLKDVDAFCDENIGKIVTGNYKLAPCTPSGVMELLKRNKIDVCGKKSVVIGRSNIVGKPMAILLLEADSTVTICHKKTRNLKEICKKADIMVVAVGKARLITEDMVKKDSVVIDVGINRDENGKLVGDVDFEKVSKKTSFITKVPGGVGPMTIAMLIKNTVKASENIFTKQQDSK